MKQGFNNIKKILVNQKYLLIGFATAIILLAILLYLTRINILIIGFGKTHTFASIFLDILLSLLAGINVALIAYKFDVSKKSSLKEGGNVIGGAFVGAVASGCPACSVTLASLLGLTGFILALPLKGLELKLLGIGVLAFSTTTLANKLECGECFFQKK